MKKVITIAASIFAALLLLSGINAVDGLSCNEFNKEPEKKMLGLLEQESQKQGTWNVNTVTSFFTNNLECLKDKKVQGVKAEGVTLDYYFKSIGTPEKNQKDYAIEVITDPDLQTLATKLEESKKRLFADWKPERNPKAKDYRARWILTLAKKNSNHCKDLKKFTENDGFDCIKGLDGGKIVEMGTKKFSMQNKDEGKTTVWAQLVQNSKSDIKLFSIVCIEKFEGACSRGDIKLLTNGGSAVQSK